MTAPTPPAGLSITVYGGPAPQGSKRYLGAPGGKGRLVESSKRVAPWRSAVVNAARQAIEVGGHDDTWQPLDGPLAVRMIFTLRKPTSAPKRRRTWPDRTPDLSKLARSTEDALKDAGAIVDDARIVEYLRLAKVFPGEDPDALDVPGARIWIGPVTTATTVPAYPVCPACDAANYGAFECPTCRAHWPAGLSLAARLAANDTTVLAEIDQAQQEVRGA